MGSRLFVPAVGFGRLFVPGAGYVKKWVLLIVCPRYGGRDLGAGWLRRAWRKGCLLSDGAGRCCLPSVLLPSPLVVLSVCFSAIRAEPSLRPLVRLWLWITCASEPCPPFCAIDVSVARGALSGSASSSSSRHHPRAKKKESARQVKRSPLRDRTALLLQLIDLQPPRRCPISCFWIPPTPSPLASIQTR